MMLPFSPSHLSLLTAALSLSSLLYTPATAASAAFEPQSPLIPQAPHDTLRERPEVHNLRLRHVFHRATAGSKHPSLHRRIDVKPDVEVWEEAEGQPRTLLHSKSLRARSSPQSIHRLANRDPQYVESVMEFGQETGITVNLQAEDWTVDEIWGPNVTDKETVLSMARVASNAYVLGEDAPDWEDVGPGFNYTDDFGWKEDGLRGHTFVDDTNSTVVIGIKGTSLSLFDGSVPSRRDKENDNLLFSCCCGQGESWNYHQVCNCKSKEAYTCNSTCLTQSLRKKAYYYHAASDIYKNVTRLYPKSQIWLVGHSLGGAVSSLVAQTYGSPAVTFASPGDAMPAKRLHLPTPPDYHLGSADSPEKPFRGTYHFGHTADPIFLGDCAGSPCSLAGYAMQSRCHTGMECVYDVNEDLGWGVSILNHRMNVYLHKVLTYYNETAKCQTFSNCTDCYNWKFFESNGTEKSSSSTSSSKTTSTSTCKTPGWFGCLDDSTTSTTVTSTTSTSTTSSKTVVTTTSTTCEHPGWFGCKDPSTTTMTTTTAKPVPSVTQAPTTDASRSSMPTTSCATPGRIWGCNDPPKTTTQIQGR